MKRPGIVALGVAGACAVLLVAVLWRREEALAQPVPPGGPGPTRSEQHALQGIAQGIGREERGAPPAAPLPEERGLPRDEQELAEYVAWLRSLGHDELLRLSNAEYRFGKSALVQMLRELEGAWVVPALGGLAVAESDPLLKAILVEGLLACDEERERDPRIVSILDSLMTQFGLRSDDPYRVGHDLAATAWAVCLRSGQDYVQWMSGHLATSDNNPLLMIGYLNMGHFAGAESLLEEMLTTHASPAGRMGALEGLRNAASRGRIPPGELTSIGLAALDSETNERNRLLLYEMMISKGGEEGLTAVEQILRAGKVSEIGDTVEMLAMKMEPGRARALFQDLLRDQELDPAARQATYNALGLIEGEEGAAFLLGLARDGELGADERLAGLRGLWNRAVDERMAGELQDVFEKGQDPALRTEALQMLVHGESEGAGVDLRSIAALDDDAVVRAEAVQLAALHPSEDTRAWLEERLHQDDSYDVKAAALGALVYHAHYTGDGDAVLGYLGRARKLTSDESALAMIAEGERMVRDHDPRRLELELAEEAEFWTRIAGHTSGAARRNFERQGRMLERLVSSLRSSSVDPPQR